MGSKASKQKFVFALYPNNGAIIDTCDFLERGRNCLSVFPRILEKEQVWGSFE